jgi:prepilin-type N-terminal cleavage/methylation domain-containing protein
LCPFFIDSLKLNPPTTIFVIINVSMKCFRVAKNKQAGFTIVELLVSVVVTTILVAGINSIYLTHLAQSQRVRNLALVNSFAENKIESLRSAGFLAISDGTTDISAQLPSDLWSPKSATLEISSATSGLKNVVLAITYNDGGQPKTLNYQTYVGELGVGQY